jgi:hypothetical protein
VERTPLVISPFSLLLEKKKKKERKEKEKELSNPFNHSRCGKHRKIKITSGLFLPYIFWKVLIACK